MIALSSYWQRECLLASDFINWYSLLAGMNHNIDKSNNSKHWNLCYILIFTTFSCI